jgi:two-component system cell cycle response regulator
VSIRILIIEDNLTNLDLMTYLLRAFGYSISSAQDGLAGLEAAKAGHYDLILTDILMPQLDGFEFARRLKAEPGLARTPLVAVTALAMTGDRERILASGFDGYISKPIEPQAFKAQIESLLREHEHGESPGHRRQ